MSTHNKFFTSILSFVLIFAFVVSFLTIDPFVAEAKDVDSFSSSIDQSISSVVIQDIVPPQPINDVDSKGIVELAAWRNLRPTESFLRGVSMLPNPEDINCSSPDQKSKGWIVGERGLILSYCNGFWDHARTTESIPTTLRSVSAVTTTLSFAVGDGGTILQYGWNQIANNYVWAKYPIVVSNKILYGLIILPEDNNENPNYSAWAIGEKDAILNKGTLIRGTITKTGGIDSYGHPIYTSSWSDVTVNFSNLPPNDYYFHFSSLNKNDIWAVGGAGTAGCAIHWNGSTWNYYEVGNTPLYGVYFVAPNDGWAAGEGGYIYHYNGSNWSLNSQPTNNLIVDLSFDSKGIGWAVGFDGTIIKYNSNLNQWNVFDDLRTDHFDFYSLDHNSGHGWLVGMNLTKGIGGQILEYSDSDDAWVAVTPPTDNLLNEISVISDNNAWAVGIGDKYGATIIHWDGKHWQRWYQKESPLPNINLRTIKMISENNGWAAADPPIPAAAAIFLHWDGIRWSLTRVPAPINVPINDLDLVTLDPSNPHDFGWAVGNNGNAVPYYDFSRGVWEALPTLYGIYYNLRGIDINSDGGSNWDAWAVGNAGFMRFMDVPTGGKAWAPYPMEGPIVDANLYSIEMLGVEPSLDGFAVGGSNNAVLYRYVDGTWESKFIGPSNSRFYSVDVVENTGTAWVGGYYTNNIQGKIAYLGYYDENGFGWAADPYPNPQINPSIYHRPISSVGFSSDSMGWAVGGDREALNKISVIYQYPFPNYSLEIIPQTQAIRPGEQANYIVSANSSGDLDATITLEINSLDPAINSSLSLNTIEINESSTLSLSTTLSTIIGDYFGWINGSFTFMSGDYPITLNRYEYFRLIVTDHPINSVDPNHGPAGTVVTITGENFGQDPGIGNRDTNENNVILAGKRMPDDSILSWSDYTITLVVPDNVEIFERGPEEGPVIVTTEGSTSNSNYSFQLENLITDVSIKKNTSEYEITVLGTSFGDDPGYPNRSTPFENIIFNGAQLEEGSVIFWDNNKIIFNTSIINLQNFVSVTSNGYKSNEFVFGESAQNIFLPLLIN